MEHLSGEQLINLEVGLSQNVIQDLKQEIKVITSAHGHRRLVFKEHNTLGGC